MKRRKKYNYGGIPRTPYSPKQVSQILREDLTTAYDPIDLSTLDNKKVKNKTLKEGLDTTNTNKIDWSGIDLTDPLLGSVLALNANLAGNLIHTIKNKPSFTAERGRLNTGLMYSFGGQTEKVPVEVEGGEIYETPQGEMGMFQGPTHEQGGIDTDLPEETKIFSERLKHPETGETMAERKVKREGRLHRLERIAKNKKRRNQVQGDKFYNNALKRVNEMNEIEEKEDMDIQEMFNASMEQIMGQSPDIMGYDGNQNEEQPAMYPWGTRKIKPKFSDPYDPSKGVLNVDSKLSDPILYPEQIKNAIIGYDPNSFLKEDRYSPSVLDKSRIPFYEDYGKEPGAVGGLKTDIRKSLREAAPTVYDDIVFPNNPIFKDEDEEEAEKKKKIMGLESEREDTGSMLTRGDRVGLAGTAIGNLARHIGTAANWAGTKKPENWFRGIGDEAIHNIDKMTGGLQSDYHVALKDITEEAGTYRGLNRKGARSINTLRALDERIAKTERGGKEKAAEGYRAAKDRLLAERGKLSMMRDRFEAEGEKHKFDVEEQQRDNFFTNLVRDWTTTEEGARNVGKVLNDAQYRKDFLKFLSAHSDNIDFTTNEKGEIIFGGKGIGTQPKTASYETGQKALNDPAYENIEWVQRLRNIGNEVAEGKYIEDETAFSTHKLAYSTIEQDGENVYVVYPTIITDENGNLKELSEKEAEEYAMENKTFIPFQNKKDAEYYSKTLFGVKDKKQRELDKTYKKHKKDIQ